MLKLVAPRDLAPIPVAAATAFVALAIFAWTERTVLVDPEGMSVPYWPWKLWQISPLLIGVGGVPVGLVEHTPSPLGAEPGAGHISSGSACQRI